MDNLNYNQYFLVIFNLFIGYLLTTNLVPLVLRLGKKYGYIDIPNSRKTIPLKK